MTCQQLLTELRSYIDSLEQHATPDAPGLQPGDIVQIHPDADRAFGGVLLRVTRVRACQVEGYLLHAHRAASREAWYRFPPTSLLYIGRVLHPEAEWATRSSAPPCPRCLSRKEPHRELSLLRLPPRAEHPRSH